MFKSKNNLNNINNQSGVVLIMSLMILLVMVISVIALSRVIVGEIKMTRNFDNSIVSFYMAESAMEEALFYLKYSKQIGNFVDYFDQLDDAQDQVFLTGDFEKSYLFSLTTTTASYFEAFDISTSSPAKADIVQADATIPTVASYLPTAYDLEWSIDNCYAGGHASDRMEVSYSSLYKSGPDLKSETQQTFVTCGCNSSSDACNLFTSSSLADNKFYYFTFRPLDDEVSYLKFTPKLADLSAHWPGQVTIQVSGFYRQSTYHMTASRPVYAPLSNVFNYVVFSEEDIEKGL